METDRETERDAQIDYHKELRALGGNPPKRMKTAGLGLWEGLPHSALLHSLIVWEYGTTVSIGLALPCIALLCL